MYFSGWNWSAVSDLIWLEVLSYLFLFASLILACMMFFWFSYKNFILVEFKFLKLGRFFPYFYCVLGLLEPKVLYASLGVACNGEVYLDEN